MTYLVRRPRRLCGRLGLRKDAIQPSCIWTPFYPLTVVPAPFFPLHVNAEFVLSLAILVKGPVLRSVSIPSPVSSHQPAQDLELLCIPRIPLGLVIGKLLWNETSIALLSSFVQYSNLSVVVKFSLKFLQSPIQLLICFEHSARSITPLLIELQKVGSLPLVMMLSSVEIRNCRSTSFHPLMLELPQIMLCALVHSRIKGSLFDLQMSMSSCTSFGGGSSFES